MKMTIYPKSKLGKLSSWFLIFFFLCFIFLIIMGVSGQEGGNKITDNLWLGIPVLMAAISGILAFIASVASLIKNKDNSLINLLGALIGILLIFFLVGELLFPH